MKRGKKAITNKEDRWIESNGTRKRQKDLAKRRNYRGEDWATIVARAFYNKEQSRTYLRIHLINIKQMFNWVLKIISILDLLNVLLGIRPKIVFQLVLHWMLPCFWRALILFRMGRGQKISLPLPVSPL